MNIKKHLINALVAGPLLLIGAQASAIPVAESGDAGDLIGTAQMLGGGVTTISGTLSPGTDVDLYGFYWGGGNFATAGLSSGVDSQLFLFDSTGLGLFHNDDRAGGGTLNSLINETLAPGLYFMGYSDFDNDPLSAGGLIFPQGGFTTTHGPTGPGGGQSLIGWDNQNSGGIGDGSYTISLRTATAAPPTGVPAPGVLSLLLIGLVGVFAGRRLRT